MAGRACRQRPGQRDPRSELRRLLGDLEADGRRRAHDLGDYRDPFVARLRALGIEAVSAVKAKAGYEGTALVGPGTYGGWGWDSPTIDRWLSELLASDRGGNKLGKLSRAAATQRHLVLVLDPFSQAGVGIMLGLTARHEREPADDAPPSLPSLVPPEPLTHVWLLPAPVETREGLAWTGEGGWTVLEAWRPPPAP